MKHCLCADKMSEIVSFYKDTAILLTGCTGFLGKILLEKLLRSCHVGKIFCLIRDKKGKIAQERFDHLLQGPLFVKFEPSQLKRIVLINGDCSEEQLNVSHCDRKLVITETNVVFHCAATIKFQQSLKTATKINIKALKYLLELAKEMKRLKAFVYTSTAYSNCDKEEIHEVIYKSPYEVETFIRFIDSFNDEFLDKITRSVLGKKPNTYVFTKALAEELLLREAKSKSKIQEVDLSENLPVVIVRPSILCSAYKEPLPGWLDSWYTVGTISVAGSYGLLRSANTDPVKLADIVPVDYVVNCLIASALRAQQWNKDSVEIPVLNYVSSVESPITWGDYTKKCFHYGMHFIPLRCFRYPCVQLSKYRLLHRLRCIYMHRLPAACVDFVLYLLGNKSFRLAYFYRLLHTFLDDTAYFSTRQWKFHNENVQTLWQSLPAIDREQFHFSMRQFNWDEYIGDFLVHGRTHLLKEDPLNIPMAQRRLRVLKLLHWATTIAEYLFLVWIGYLLLKCFNFI